MHNSWLYDQVVSLETRVRSGITPEHRSLEEKHRMVYTEIVSGPSLLDLTISLVEDPKLHRTVTFHTLGTGNNEVRITGLERSNESLSYSETWKFKGEIWGSNCFTRVEGSYSTKTRTGRLGF